MKQPPSSTHRHHASFRQIHTPGARREGHTKLSSSAYKSHRGKSTRTVNRKHVKSQEQPITVADPLSQLPSSGLSSVSPPWYQHPHRNTMHTAHSGLRNWQDRQSHGRRRSCQEEGKSTVGVSHQRDGSRSSVAWVARPHERPLQQTLYVGREQPLARPAAGSVLACSWLSNRRTSR